MTPGRYTVASRSATAATYLCSLLLIHEPAAATFTQLLSRSATTATRLHTIALQGQLRFNLILKYPLPSLTMPPHSPYASLHMPPTLLVQLDATNFTCASPILKSRNWQDKVGDMDG